MNRLNIVIYRNSAEELDRIFDELLKRLSISNIYVDYDRLLLSVKDGLLYPVYIDGRTGPCEKLAGIRPDFYNTDDKEMLWFLKQGASKVNGVKLDDVLDVLKIVDILKIQENEKDD